jgi:hypothetical protein
MNDQRQPHDSPTKRSGPRRGAIVVLAAIMIIVFLASVAFSVDVAYMQLTKIKLRSAADAAARAAGETLSRVQSESQARQAAKDIAAANLVAGEPLMLADSDVIFGKSTQQANGAWAFTPGAQPVNAVRVNGRRTRDAPSGSVPIFFGRVFNVLDFQPVQAATVVRLDRDICLVVDRSSSMKLFLSDSSPTMSTSDSRFCQPPNMLKSRWGALSIGIDRFVQALDTTPQSEYVALVSFSSNYTACSYTNNASDINCPLSANSSAVLSAMATLSSKKFNGMTDIGAGITKGIQVLTSASARPYAAKTMVLMSDGAYTAGQVPHVVAAQAATKDIIIHTITYGEADPVEMKAIADATGGKNYIAPDAQALQDAFEEIALTLPVVFTD